jgi:hypothetical protein
MKMKWFYLAPAWALLALLLSGCGARDESVALRYEPGPAAGGCGLKVAVLGFSDRRAGEEIGLVGNTRVRPDSDVAEWVADAVASEFKARGCDVLRELDQDSPFPPDYVVSGDVREIFLAKDLWSYSLRMKVRLQARSGEEVAFQRIYRGNWQKKTLAAAEDAEELLADALNEFLADIMSEMMPVLRAGN